MTQSRFEKMFLNAQSHLSQEDREFYASIARPYLQRMQGEWRAVQSNGDAVYDEAAQFRKSLRDKIHTIDPSPTPFMVKARQVGVTSEIEKRIARLKAEQDLKGLDE